MTSRHQDARRDERDNAGSLDPPIPMLVSDVGVIPFERFSLNVIAVLDRQRNTSRFPAELSDNCSAEFETPILVCGSGKSGTLRRTCSCLR